ncbi:dATP/dGTP pyrophosphohydrolase domain-containing protein [Kiloniella litopenaei]|uniref:dATP/dGTP pyrophosphohydrolase domain-containing protein n=1 Tax=Kiloniella litopenaei TaxID=1549748 RepID=UPI003BAB7B35
METQTTICDWAEKTFGPVKNANDLLKRAMLETTELSEAIAENNIKEIGKETADVVILLYRLLDQYGLDLNKEINEKMAINRARKWKSKGDGTGSHIK